MDEDDSVIDLLTQELLALNLRAKRIEAEILSLRESNVRNAPGIFAKDDRVRITNKVRKPANWLKVWNQTTVESERLATVTHQVRDQVWIVTDNGTKTWRAPNNLEHIR